MGPHFGTPANCWYYGRNYDVVDVTDLLTDCSRLARYADIMKSHYSSVLYCTRPHCAERSEALCGSQTWKDHDCYRDNCSQNKHVHMVGLQNEFLAAFYCQRPRRAERSEALARYSDNYEISVFSRYLLLTAALRGAKRSAVRFPKIIKANVNTFTQTSPALITIMTKRTVRRHRGDYKVEGQLLLP